MYKYCQMTWASRNQRIYAEGWLLQSKHLPQAYVALSYWHRAGLKTGPNCSERNTWTRICPWAYTYVKRQQICFERKGKTSLSTAASLIHCSTPTLYDISSSLLSTARMILFISFSCYTLEWDKTIFTIILSRKMLQKLTVSVVKSLLLNFHPLSNIMLCLK